MRLDVASACNAFNGQSGGAKEQKEADFAAEKPADSNSAGSVDRSGNDNNRAANDNKVSLPAALSRYDLNDMTIK